MRQSRIKFCITFLLIVLLPYFCEAGTKKSSTGKRRLLRVTFVDVGQGDCEFIRTPGGKTILVDAGPGATEYDNFDAGKKIVVPYLKSLKVKKIDYVVMSHAHNDHIGGLRAVLKNFPVGNFVDPGFDYPSWVYEDILKLVDKKKIKYVEAHAGDVFKWDKYCRIEVFNPPEKYFRGGSEANENSIILKLTYKKVSFLFTGDAERKAERFVVKHFKDELMCTFLKVAHHGSATSTSQEFLDWSQPLVAVIEVGQGNRWGHPKREVLKRLKEYGCQIYRTDRNGFVEVITDGKKYKLRHFDFWAKESNYGEGYE
ncbi:MAG: MBL fold metallo-hydrolase [Elusimicrobia bacterium]|nr:MBL fold metallo-hydrolase [Elusimicrobiota bacterium]